MCLCISDKCSPGYRPTADQESCEKCPRGFYQPLPDQTDCLRCMGAMMDTRTEGAMLLSECERESSFIVLIAARVVFVITLVTIAYSGVPIIVFCPDCSSCRPSCISRRPDWIWGLSCNLRRHDCNSRRLHFEGLKPEQFI